MYTDSCRSMLKAMQRLADVCQNLFSGSTKYQVPAVKISDVLKQAVERSVGLLQELDEYVQGKAEYTQYVTICKNRVKEFVERNQKVKHYTAKTQLLENEKKEKESQGKAQNVNDLQKIPRVVQYLNQNVEKKNFSVIEAADTLQKLNADLFNAQVKGHLYLGPLIASFCRTSQAFHQQIDQSIERLPNLADPLEQQEDVGQYTKNIFDYCIQNDPSFIDIKRGFLTPSMLPKTNNNTSNSVFSAKGFGQMFDKFTKAKFFGTTGGLPIDKPPVDFHSQVSMQTSTISQQQNWRSPAYSQNVTAAPRQASPMNLGQNRSSVDNWGGGFTDNRSTPFVARQSVQPMSVTTRDKSPRRNLFDETPYKQQQPVLNNQYQSESDADILKHLDDIDLKYNFEPPKGSGYQARSPRSRQILDQAYSSNYQQQKPLQQSKPANQAQTLRVSQLALNDLKSFKECKQLITTDESDEDA